MGLLRERKSVRVGTVSELNEHAYRVQISSEVAAIILQKLAEQLAAQAPQVFGALIFNAQCIDLGHTRPVHRTAG